MVQQTSIKKLEYMYFHSCCVENCTVILHPVLPHFNPAVTLIFGKYVVIYDSYGMIAVYMTESIHLECVDEDHKQAGGRLSCVKVDTNINVNQAHYKKLP